MEVHLDKCGQQQDGYIICRLCWQTLIKAKFPKLDYANFVNVCVCQNYPEALEDLTLVEEAIIALAHLIISIIKL